MTLDTIRQAASPELYPRHVLDGCESALVLFAAAWHGKQDAIWIAEAGLTATCVDTDHERLAEMARVYPEGWEFVHGDAFAYAQATWRQWDVVSVDCPTNLFGRCAEMLPVWCSLARRAVVLGTGVGTELDPPAGCQILETRARSSFQGGVYWTVITPC